MITKRLKAFAAGLSFLTIVPIRFEEGISDEEIADSRFYFPFVGLLIGSFLAFVYFLLLKLDADIAGFGVVAVGLFITGGLHADGFADTVDGLCGGKNKLEILDIMQRGSIGPLGAAWLCLILLFKFIIITKIPQNLVTCALISMAMASRTTMACLTFIFPYARHEGKAKAFFGEHSFKNTLRICFYGIVLCTVIWCVFQPVTYSFFEYPFLMILFFTAASAGLFFLNVFGVGLVCASYLESKIYGLTGDTLGAINEVVEVFVLLLLFLVFRTQI